MMRKYRVHLRRSRSDDRDVVYTVGEDDIVTATEPHGQGIYWVGKPWADAAHFFRRETVTEVTGDAPGTGDSASRVESRGL